MKKAQQTENKGNVLWFKYTMSSLGLCFKYLVPS